MSATPKTAPGPMVAVWFSVMMLLEATTKAMPATITQMTRPKSLLAILKHSDTLGYTPHSD
jgi:hypothetical protein